MMDLDLMLEVGAGVEIAEVEENEKGVKNSNDWKSEQ